MLQACARPQERYLPLGCTHHHNLQAGPPHLSPRSHRCLLSLPKIGQTFGGRDHTTVMHADRKIRQLMAERRSIYNQVTELTNRIKQQARN